MNALIPLKFEDRDLCAIDRDGEPWFVASDVCAILGLGNVGQALARLDDDERTSITIDDVSQGTPVRMIVSESGLYSLTLRSRKPAAKRFKKWVTHEVLPSIRRTGQFGADAARALNDPATLRGLLLGATEQVLALKPKADALDRIATAKGSLCITDAAKALQVAPKKLFGHLLRENWIYRRPGANTWLGYQERVRAGVIEHKVIRQETEDGAPRIREQCRITPKGLALLATALSSPAARSDAA